MTWDAIPYTGDGGNYEVFCGTTPGGPYSSQGATADKTVTTLSAGSLSPATPYFCVVRTFTPSHGSHAIFACSGRCASNTTWAH